MYLSNWAHIQRSTEGQCEPIEEGRIVKEDQQSPQARLHQCLRRVLAGGKHSHIIKNFPPYLLTSIATLLIDSVLQSQPIKGH